MDNFLRPFLIKKGADLPLLLIFAGVIGGLIAFGIIGPYIGPVVLAMAYSCSKHGCRMRCKCKRASSSSSERDLDGYGRGVSVPS